MLIVTDARPNMKSGGKRRNRSLIERLGTRSDRLISTERSGEDRLIPEGIKAQMEGFDEEHAKAMIRAARLAIKRYMQTGRIMRADLPEEIDKQAGVFVTLRKQGKSVDKLRGCIGFPEPIYELSRGLTKAAVSAAFSDPRFPPLDEEELPEITIEVSLLSQPMLLTVPKTDLAASVAIGKHGIIVERGINKGLLLPQVAVEEGWDPESFLSFACLKAGLPPDSWLDDKTEVYVFTATVFKEMEPEGDVVELRPGS